MTSEFDSIQVLIGLAKKGDSTVLDLLALWVDDMHEMAHDMGHGTFKPRQSDHFLTEHKLVNKAYQDIREYLNKVQPYGPGVRF